jgi:hypothetical protein
MGDRAWQVPAADFAAAWNAARSLTEAAEAVKRLAGGQVPRWAVMARAGQLRKHGLALKELRAGAEAK